MVRSVFWSEYQQGLKQLGLYRFNRIAPLQGVMLLPLVLLLCYQLFCLPNQKKIK
jgi:hypothetical protein